MDLRQLVLVEEALGGRDRDVGPVVHVEAEDLALGLHDPDDEEPPAADADALAERVRLAEELVRELRPQHRLGAARGAGSPGGRKRPCRTPNWNTRGMSEVTPETSTRRERSPELDAPPCRRRPGSTISMPRTRFNASASSIVSLRTVAESPGMPLVVALPLLIDRMWVPNCVNSSTM